MGPLTPHQQLDGQGQELYAARSGRRVGRLHLFTDPPSAYLETSLDTGDPVGCYEVEPGVLIHYDGSGSTVGIEVLKHRRAGHLGASAAEG